MKKQYVFILCVVLMLLCGCQKAETRTTAATTDKESNPSKTMSWEAPTEYQEVLNDYANLLAFRLSSNFELEYNSGKMITMHSSLSEISQGGTDLSYNWHCMLVEMTEGAKYRSKDDFGIDLKDLNNDAFPELFWIRSDGAILAAFSVCAGEPYLLDAFWPRHSCYIIAETKLRITSSGGVNYTNHEIKSIDASRKILTTERMFGIDGWDSDANSEVYYEAINGQRQRITKEYYAELLEKFS